VSRPLRRGEIYRVRQPQHGDPKKSRCLVIVSRQELVDSKANRILCAPVYRQGFGLATEVPVAESEGLQHASVINCDRVTRLERRLLTDFIGKLSAAKRMQLKMALRIAPGIE